MTTRKRSRETAAAAAGASVAAASLPEVIVIDDDDENMVGNGIHMNRFQAPLSMPMINRRTTNVQPSGSSAQKKSKLHDPVPQISVADQLAMMRNVLGRDLNESVLIYYLEAASYNPLSAINLYIDGEEKKANADRQQQELLKYIPATKAARKSLPSNYLNRNNDNDNNNNSNNEADSDEEVPHSFAAKRHVTMASRKLAPSSSAGSHPVGLDRPRLPYLSCRKQAPSSFTGRDDDDDDADCGEGANSEEVDSEDDRFHPLAARKSALAMAGRKTAPDSSRSGENTTPTPEETSTDEDEIDMDNNLEYGILQNVRPQNAIYDWNSKLLWELTIDANSTTFGFGVLKPGDAISFTRQPTFFFQNMLLQSIGPRSANKRNDFENDGVSLHSSKRILRFVKAGNEGSLEIGRMPQKISDAVVSLYDEGMINLRGKCINCPMSVDTLTRMKITLEIHVCRELFRLTADETKVPGADMIINTFIELLKSLGIDPVKSSTVLNETVLDQPYNFHNNMADSTELEDADIPSVEYEEETMAQAEEIRPETKVNTKQLKSIYSLARSRNLPEADPPPGLKTTLHAYQKQALYWMANREHLPDLDSNRSQSSTNSAESSATEKNENVRKHPLFDEYAFLDGTRFYINPYSPQLSLAFPKAQAITRGGILADEMGMGKTVMSVALMLHKANSNPSSTTELKSRTTLIICPMSLLQQWVDEITRFSSLSTLLFYGERSQISPAILASKDVVITSYGTLAAETRSPSSILLEHSWNRVILDEAHVIRNCNTEYSKAAFKLNAERRWCLTGTPIQNSIQDVFALLHFLKEEPWGNTLWWAKMISRPYAAHDNRAVQRLKAVLHPLMLRRTKNMVGQNGNAILSLPPRTDHTIRLRFSATESDFYNALYHKTQTQLEGFVKQGVLLHKYVQILTLLLRLRMCANHPYLVIGKEKDDKDWDKAVNRFIDRFIQKQVVTDGGAGPSLEYIENVAQALRKMKKSAVQTSISETFKGADISGDNSTSPRQQIIQGMSSTPESASSSMDSSSQTSSPQITEEKKEEEEEVWNECPICLCEPEEAVISICGHVYCRACVMQLFTARGNASCAICRTVFSFHNITTLPTPSPTVAGMDFQQQWKHSTKTARLLLELEQLQLKDNSKSTKVLVFSQWTSMLDLIQIPLKQADFKYLRLDGSLSQRARENVLKSFREDSSYTILLISLKAGGVGLNLVCASIVFFLDPWWNPAVEEQAIQRVHRIGQTKPVEVYRFLMEETVEERISQLQEKKLAMAKSIHDGGKSESKLEISELINLFKDFRKKG